MMEIVNNNSDKRSYFFLVCVSNSVLADESFEFLGVGYIRSYLMKQGYDSLIFNVNDTESEVSLLKEIRRNKPYFIGFPTYVNNAYKITELVSRIKCEFPNIHITLGGPSVNNCEIKILEYYPWIDSVVSGEGEETMCELAQRLSREESLENCKGLTVRLKNGEIVKGPSRELVEDLDRFPFPDRAMFEQQKPNYIRIIGHRGCTGACTFCSSGGAPIQQGSRLRFRSAKNIVDEMQLLQEKYDMDYFEFLEDSFIESQYEYYVDEFISEIVNRQLKVWFTIFCRAEQISKNELVRNLLIRLKNIGLDMVFVGLEAGNDEDLKYYHKRARVEDNQKAIEFLREQNISLRFGWIMFHPFSTYDSLSASALFLRNNSIAYDMGKFLTQLEIYPNTTIIPKLVKEGLMEVSDHPFNNVYDYQFRHKEISCLAKAIKELIPKNDESGMLWAKVLTFEARMKRKTLSDQVKSLLSEIDKYKAQRSEINYHSFISALNMSKAGASINELIKFCKAEQQKNEESGQLSKLFQKLLYYYTKLNK